MRFELESHHRDVPNEELIGELQCVAALLSRHSVTIDQFNEHGKCHTTPFDNDAFVSRITGNVHWSPSTIELDDELPENIEDGSIYVAVPNKHDLNLGKNPALTFTEEQLADSYQTVANIFRQRGAYGRFKDLLERKGCLQAWYDYEAPSVNPSYMDSPQNQGN